MAGNKMKRLKLLDSAFQTGRTFGLEELREWCMREGRMRSYARETIRKDISELRKLGAPIPKRCPDRRYYYTDASWALVKNPLTPGDLLLLHRATHLLRQFPGIAFAERLKKLVEQLDKRYQMDWPRKTPRIFFQPSPDIKGLTVYLDRIYSHIEKEESILLHYQPFKYPTPKWLQLSPYFLQEYNFRWYLIARHHQTDAIQLFAIDRTRGVKKGKSDFRPPPPDFEPASYFKEVVGVSIPRDGKVREVKLRVHKELAPYLQTKFLHPSQQRELKKDGSMLISIQVIPNYELKRDILGWGDKVKVLEPPELAEEIAEAHRKAAALYEPFGK